MMYGSSAFALHLHWIFVLMLLLGLIGAVVWMARFATKAQVKSITWLTLLLGALGMLLTANLAFDAMRSMMSGEWGSDDFIEDMMDWEEE